MPLCHRTSLAPQESSLARFEKNDPACRSCMPVPYSSSPVCVHVRTWPYIRARACVCVTTNIGRENFNVWTAFNPSPAAVVPGPLIGMRSDFDDCESSGRTLTADFPAYGFSGMPVKRILAWLGDKGGFYSSAGLLRRGSCKRSMLWCDWNFCLARTFSLSFCVRAETMQRDLWYRNFRGILISNI